MTNNVGALLALARRALRFLKTRVLGAVLGAVKIQKQNTETDTFLLIPFRSGRRNDISFSSAL
jgi:hypothetical protein